MWWALKLMYIKYQITHFFVWRLDMILTHANPLLGLLEGVGFTRFYFRAQKSLDFQSPPLSLDLVMDVAHIKTITFGAIHS
jgi:hypothetical protein